MFLYQCCLKWNVWNIEQEKDREKEKVGGRPAKLNEKKGDRDLEREINNSGGKMRNASEMQGGNEQL